MVGSYLLIEKAFAKYKGSYLNLKGSNNNKDLYFFLTGVKEKRYLLTDDFLMKYQEVIEFKEKNTKEIQKKLKEKKEKVIKEKKKEKKEINIKEIEEKIKKYGFREEIKREIIEKKELKKESKEKIFNDIKEFSEKNLVNVGTEDEILIGEKTLFGIYSNHMYDFLDCEKHNDSLFFSLWNPHGNNKLKGKENNNYQGFDEINKKNKKGLFNGNIILSFDNFFLSFHSIVYQNGDELLKMCHKYNCKGFLYLLGKPPLNFIFMSQFGFDINFIITMLLIRSRINKGKTNKQILSELFR